MKIFNYFFVCMSIVLSINAQTITFNEDSTKVIVENNRISFPFNNEGTLAFARSFSPDWDNFLYDGELVLFAGGFFLSGYSDTTLWANVEAESFLFDCYEAGNIGDSSNTPDNIIYAVKESDIPFGSEWQNWKTAVEQGAYFYDGENDGIYNPVDKNNNGQWDADEDKPDILYDASLFTVFNDSGYRRWEDEPIGIEIRQTVFVSNRNTILDDVIFVRYSILYKGLGNENEPDSLKDVIFGVWTDDEIGAYYDNLSGCDILLKSGFSYNYLDDPHIGNNPPAVFKTIVQGPLSKSDNPNSIGYNRMGPDLGQKEFNGFKNVGMEAFVNFLDHPNYNTVKDIQGARNYSLGLTQEGDSLDPCSWSFGEVKGDFNCDDVNPLFWLSGDPVTDSGWLGAREWGQYGLTSTGKFTLHKNEPMDIIVAYTVGRGIDALNSITVARETVQYVLEEYERNFSTVVGVEESEQEKELPSTFTLYQNYPNPFNPSTTIKFSIPNVVDAYYASTTNTTLKVYDILGREIKILINKKLQPGEYKVEFDASDLPSGVYFYRLNAGAFSESKKMLLLK